MTTHEVELTSPLKEELVKEFNLKVHDGERFRAVAARAIMPTDGISPVIDLGLGENRNAGFISGGEAVLRTDEPSVETVRVEPIDVTDNPVMIRPVMNGNEPVLGLYKLSDEVPGPETAGVDDAAESRQ